MTDRDKRVAAYEAHLTTIYAPELTSLANRFGVLVQIVNTGGGCTAIEAIIGTAPGTEHPLELLVTTTDPGLADNRDDIAHWLIGLYDAEEGGEPLAEGHDTQSFEAAIETAIRNLEAGITPTVDTCDCHT